MSYTPTQIIEEQKNLRVATISIDKKSETISNLSRFKALLNNRKNNYYLQV